MPTLTKRSPIPRLAKSSKFYSGTKPKEEKEKPQRKTGADCYLRVVVSKWGVASESEVRYIRHKRLLNVDQRPGFSSLWDADTPDRNLYKRNQDVFDVVPAGGVVEGFEIVFAPPTYSEIEVSDRLSRCNQNPAPAFWTRRRVGKRRALKHLFQSDRFPRLPTQRPIVAAAPVVSAYDRHLATVAAALQERYGDRFAAELLQFAA